MQNFKLSLNSSAVFPAPPPSQSLRQRSQPRRSSASSLLTRLSGIQLGLLEAPGGRTVLPGEELRSPRPGEGRGRAVDRSGLCCTLAALTNATAGPASPAGVSMRASLAGVSMALPAPLPRPTLPLPLVLAGCRCTAGRRRRGERDREELCWRLRCSQQRETGSWQRPTEGDRGRTGVFHGITGVGHCRVTFASFTRSSIGCCAALRCARGDRRRSCISTSPRTRLFRCRHGRSSGPSPSCR